ncbi:MAG: peptide deformylase [Chlamydiota bacterium]
MSLQLCFYGDPVLRKRCSPVKEITPSIKNLVQEMIETMDAYKGIGLAASQVGVLLQIFVVRKEKKMPDGSISLGDAKVYINPELFHPSKEMVTMAEGCLSLPGLTVDVARPDSIYIRYQDLEGTVQEEKVSGFDARVLMHENDHLHGRLTIDRTTVQEKERTKPYLKDLKKKYQKVSKRS